MRKKSAVTIDCREFELITGIEVEEETEVPTKKILITSDIKSSKTVKPVLRDWDGLYSIEEGPETMEKTRKCRDETICARVVKMYPTGMELPEEKWYLEMEKRKEEGLWDGDLIFSLDENGEYAGGTATVHTYEGIWVLAKNMEEVRAAYQRAGAGNTAV